MRFLVYPHMEKYSPPTDIRVHKLSRGENSGNTSNRRDVWDFPKARFLAIGFPPGIGLGNVLEFTPTIATIAGSLET